MGNIALKGEDAAGSACEDCWPDDGAAIFRADKIDIAGVEYDDEVVDGRALITLRCTCRRGVPIVLASAMVVHLLGVSWKMRAI